VNLDFSKLSRKAHLPSGREFLRREYKDLVLQPRSVDRAENLFGNAVRQSYAGDLGTEMLGQRSYGKGRSEVNGGVHLR